MNSGMNSARHPRDIGHRMHLPTPDVDPDPHPPPDDDPDPVLPDGTPRPIGDPPDSSPPERVLQAFCAPAGKASAFALA